MKAKVLLLLVFPLLLLAGCTQSYFQEPTAQEDPAAEETRAGDFSVIRYTSGSPECGVPFLYGYSRPPWVNCYMQVESLTVLPGNLVIRHDLQPTVRQDANRVVYITYYVAGEYKITAVSQNTPRYGEYPISQKVYLYETVTPQLKISGAGILRTPGNGEISENSRVWLNQSFTYTSVISANPLPYDLEHTITLTVANLNANGLPPTVNYSGEGVIEVTFREIGNYKITSELTTPLPVFNVTAEETINVPLKIIGTPRDSLIVVPILPI